MAPWLKLFLIDFLVVLATSASAQLGPKDGTELPSTDLDRVRVGSRAPDFTLESSDGAVISLSDSVGKESVVLVFYRGHW